MQQHDFKTVSFLLSNSLWYLSLTVTGIIIPVFINYVTFVVFRSVTFVSELNIEGK